MSLGLIAFLNAELGKQRHGSRKRAPELATPGRSAHDRLGRLQLGQLVCAGAYRRAAQLATQRATGVREAQQLGSFAAEAGWRSAPWRFAPQLCGGRR